MFENFICRIALVLVLSAAVGSPAVAQVPDKPDPVKPAPVKPIPVKPDPVKPIPVKPVEIKPAQVKPARIMPIQKVQTAQIKVEVQAEVLDDAVEELVAQPVFMFADENFDQWLYRDLQNTAGARSRLDALLLLRIEDVVQACRLTEVQRQKLQLAGRGDIKRFFDRIEELRRKFQLVKTDQNRVGEILQEIQPLQVVFQTGPFGDASIFTKTLKTTLTSGQVISYETAGRERRAFRYQACVELLVTKLDEALVLRAEERRQFEWLLLDETRPPARFSPYDQQVVLLQAARIPEEKLKKLFDERQWALLGRQFAKAREIEPFLKSNGFLPDSP